MAERRLNPTILWAQRSNTVLLTVSLSDMRNEEFSLEENVFKFRGNGGPDGHLYSVELEFFKAIVPQESRHKRTDRGLYLVIKKKKEGPYWSRLLSVEKKPSFVKTDFNRWKDEDDSEEEDECKDSDLNSQMSGTGMNMGDVTGMRGDRRNLDLQGMEELESILKCEPTPQPVSPDPRAQDKKLKLRYNVVYIVAGIVFKEGKLLRIQEAKPDCRGAWYLPAGRMEPNETVVEAVKREVEEESGLTFEPEAVIAVECMSGHAWVRVTLAGQVTGGNLKTTAQADKESLQAGWFSPMEMQYLNLRANDILRLIEIGRQRAEGRKYDGLPVEVGHVSSSLRIILVAHDNTQLLVLERTKPQGSTNFPVVDISYHNIERELKSCGYKGDYKVHGVLSLEHLGRPCGVYDGMCVSVLVEACTRELETSEFVWTQVEHTLEKRLKDALEKCAQLLL